MGPSGMIYAGTSVIGAVYWEMRECHDRNAEIYPGIP